MWMLNEGKSRRCFSSTLGTFHVCRNPIDIFVDYGDGVVYMYCVWQCVAVYTVNILHHPAASHCQLSQQSSGRYLKYKWRHGAQQGYLMATTEWMEHLPSPGGWTGTLWRWRMRITPSTTDPGLNTEILVFISWIIWSWSCRSCSWCRWCPWECDKFSWREM